MSAHLCLMGFRSVCRSFVLNMMGSATANNVSSRATFVRLMTSMFDAVNQFWESGQKSSSPPVKKSPMSR